MNDIVFATTTQLAAAIWAGNISSSEVLEAHAEVTGTFKRPLGY